MEPWGQKWSLGLSPFEMKQPSLILSICIDHSRYDPSWKRHDLIGRAPEGANIESCLPLALPAAGTASTSMKGELGGKKIVFHHIVFKFKVFFPLEIFMYLSFQLLCIPLVVCIDDSSSSFRNQLKHQCHSETFLASFFLLCDLQKHACLLTYYLPMRLRAPLRQEAHKFDSTVYHHLTQSLAHNKASINCFKMNG